MSKQALVSNEKWVIERKNKNTGYTEQIVYTGSLKNKPKGWKVVKSA